MRNGLHGIQCTRTFGDKWIPQIIREPEIMTTSLQHKDVLVLATDGVFTTANLAYLDEETKDVADMIANDPKLSAEDITYYGMEIREAHDNATTILIRIT